MRVASRRPIPMRTPLLALAVTLAATATLGVTSIARAQESAPNVAQTDVSRPADRGEVVVIPPSDQVTIVTVLPSLPAERYAAPGPTQAAPASLPLPSGTTTSRPSAWVHLQGGPNLRLEAVAQNETDWKQVCRAPCDTWVPLDAVYRVTSPGMQTSKTVHIEASDGERVVVEVDPTTEATHVAGEALIITGGVAVLTGGVLLYADAVSAGLCSMGGCSSSPGLLWAGLGSAAVGAVGLIAGIRMIQPTGVEQGAAGREAPGSVTSRDDRFRRLPAWREPSQVGSSPTVTSFPVFSTTF